MIKYAGKGKKEATTENRYLPCERGGGRGFAGERFCAEFEQQMEAMLGRMRSDDEQCGVEKKKVGCLKIVSQVAGTTGTGSGRK